MRPIDRADAPARPLLTPLRLVLAAASVLVVIAAIQLFVLTDRTDRFFAWTVAPRVAAAADGAFYLAALFVLAPAAAANDWVRARGIAMAVLVVSTTKLAATLLHLGPFHFDGGDLTGQVAAWGWLIVYAAIPPGLLALVLAQHRVRGSDPPRRRPFPTWFARVAAAQASVMGLAGLLLLAIPSRMSRVWPWSITPLTARALAAWFLGIGVLASATALERDFERTPHVMAGSLALGLLQVATLLRYGDEVRWGKPLAWVYVVLFVGLAAIGVYGVLQERRSPGARTA